MLLETGAKPLGETDVSVAFRVQNGERSRTTASSTTFFLLCFFFFAILRFDYTVLMCSSLLRGRWRRVFNLFAPPQQRFICIFQRFIVTRKISNLLCLQCNPYFFVWGQQLEPLLSC